MRRTAWSCTRQHRFRQGEDPGPGDLVDRWRDDVLQRLVHPCGLRCAHRGPCQSLVLNLHTSWSQCSRPLAWWTSYHLFDSCPVNFVNLEHHPNTDSCNSTYQWHVELCLKHIHHLLCNRASLPFVNFTDQIMTSAKQVSRVFVLLLMLVLSIAC